MLRYIGLIGLVLPFCGSSRFGLCRFERCEHLPFTALLRSYVDSGWFIAVLVHGLFCSLLFLVSFL